MELLDKSIIALQKCDVFNCQINFTNNSSIELNQEIFKEIIKILKDGLIFNILLYIEARMNIINQIIR